ncbi:hypothetical protein GJV85_13375 (plasmid) [Sulfurimonas aquatica]|uniref:Uncharacterized protein n=1 Tax=Sulfurimonas aquatica TaxID=2672570 RepID=A0A975GDX0_9BACT|nr:hypothetical protein [Sulfurimonas aquatica]QSZ43161.1 hypothetical protein GJV85_13375 [Sulfurimonas aquatica]
MQIDDFEDPYNTPLYQAKLVEQDKEIYLKEILPKSDELIEAQIQVEISLTTCGVELIYNSKVLKFRDEEDRICFQRSINAFFISQGFKLENIFYPILIYKCATTKNRKNLFVHSDNRCLNEDEIKEWRSNFLKIYRVFFSYVSSKEG